MKYTVEVNEKGTYWFKEGTKILHREDGPACEWANGDKFWYKNGKLHREDGFAFETILDFGSIGSCKYWKIKESTPEGYPLCMEEICPNKYYINDTQVKEEQLDNRNKQFFTTEEIKNMSLHELHKCLS
jgi:hypothetical protein